MPAARNIAIVALVALAVFAIPGGGTAADLLYALLSIVFFALLAFAAGRFYREHRTDIYSLSPRDRTLGYGAIVVALVTLSASARLLASTGGVIVWLALLGASVWALLFVYRAWRAY